MSIENPDFEFPNEELSRLFSHGVGNNGVMAIGLTESQPACVQTLVEQIQARFNGGFIDEFDASMAVKFLESIESSGLVDPDNLEDSGLVIEKLMTVFENVGGEKISVGVRQLVLFALEGGDTDLLNKVKEEVLEVEEQMAITPDVEVPQNAPRITIPLESSGEVFEWEEVLSHALAYVSSAYGTPYLEKRSREFEYILDLWSASRRAGKPLADIEVNEIDGKPYLTIDFPVDPSGFSEEISDYLDSQE